MPETKICPSPFFIWFTGRTGSTFLCDLLDSHPEIYCRKEDFSEIRVDDVKGMSAETPLVDIDGTQFSRKVFMPNGVIEHPTAEQSLSYLDQIYSMPHRACGFKLKFPNQSLVFPEVAQRLNQIGELKVIELLRLNVLKQAISLRNVARVQGLPQSQSSNVMNRVDLQPLVLDVPATVGHARFFLRTRAQFQQRSAEFKDVLTVTYEQLNASTKDTLTRILEFLGVDRDIDLHSEFQKITPDRIQDAVANYDELVDAIQGTDLEPFLD